MKKNLYITAFTLLGYLVQKVLHGLVEIGYINLLLFDFKRYGLGLSWDNIVLINHILTGLLLFLGLWTGFRLGNYWWKRIYEEKGVRRLVNLTK